MKDAGGTRLSAFRGCILDADDGAWGECGTDVFLAAEEAGLERILIGTGEVVFDWASGFPFD